jgi:hypothetical protein
MQEAHDGVVKKMKGNMDEVFKEMTLSRAEAVKAAQDEASQRRQGLVHQNQVSSKEVLRLRESEFRGGYSCFLITDVLFIQA